MAQIISNPRGLGDTDSVDQKVLPRVIEIEAASAIAANYAVALNSSTVKVAIGATNDPVPIIGIVRNSPVAAGELAEVVVWGPVAGVPAQGSIADKAILKASGTTAGYVATTASPAAGEALGFAVGASASNAVTVFVCKSL